MIRPGAIGDTIVSLPALERLRADYTEVWVRSPIVPLIRWADRVRSLSSVGLDLLELGLDCPAASLLKSFDSIVSWYGANRPEFRSAVAALPVEFQSALPAEAGSVHAVDFYMRQAGGPDGAIPVVDAPRKRRDFVAIHPFSGSPKKNWPLGRFRELVSALPYPVEFSAGPDEALEPARRFDDLWELACWLAGAKAYVGNDSGVTHLAAAVGTPVIAIFSVTDPDVWAPRGRAEVRLLRGTPDVAEVRSALEGLLAL